MPHPSVFIYKECLSGVHQALYRIYYPKSHNVWYLQAKVLDVNLFSFGIAASVKVVSQSDK